MPLIILEGPDGSGTTTHSALLAETLRKEGRDVLLTCEPTDGPIGRFIRGELSKEKIDSPAALQLLFTADRAWHVDTVIRPALEAGKTVITDRFSLSTIVYGEALGIDKEWLESMNKKITDIYNAKNSSPSFAPSDISSAGDPELVEGRRRIDQYATLILCLPPFETCMERMEKREFQDVLEKREFQKKVYDLYKQYAEENQIDVIDTSKEKEEVAHSIFASILN